MERKLVMTATISRLYDSYSEASEAVANLEAAGVKHSDISILVSNADNWYSADRKPDTFPDRERKPPEQVRGSGPRLEELLGCWPGLA